MSRVGAQRPRLELVPGDIDGFETGDEVIEFARRFGLELDDWQQWVVRNMCAERCDGTWAATNSVLLVPRQCGKSAILEAIEMAALFLWEESHVIYSAHLGKTATDHMRRIRRHIDAHSDFRSQCRVMTGVGTERVETHDGRILEFITRGKKTARGGSPNRVIFDEAMFLTDDQIQAMLPSLSAQSLNEDGAAQMIYASSAPIAESEVLHRLRKRAIEEKPNRMFFAEWSVSEGTATDDRDGWYQANPGLGVRISEEWVADNEFGTLSDEAFGVERLGIPEMPLNQKSVGPISPDEWSALTDGSSSVVAETARVAADAGNGWHVAAVAGDRPDGLKHGGLVVSNQDEGVFVAELKAACDALDVSTVTLPKGSPGEALSKPLRAAGLEVDLMTSTDQALATSELIKAATGLAPTLRHRGEPSLSKAFGVAVTKPAGNGGQVWVRPATGDIAAVFALTMAFGRLGSEAKKPSKQLGRVI